MRLTLSRRLAAGAAAAVAFAIVLASVVVYLETQHVLRSQVDESLRDIVPRVKVIQSRFSQSVPAPPAEAGRKVAKEFSVRVPNATFGGAAGIAQALAPNGDVVGKKILPARDLLAAKPGTLKDVTRDGTHLRVFVTGGPLSGDKLVVARPLTEVDGSLKRLRIILLLVSLGGIALAGGLGLAVARGAIAPMRRLTAEAEHVAATQDLSRRMPSGEQDDEIDRLGAAFNTMLAALESSREAQRQLVADASHELRTPLTSIRTNIEVLGRAKDLPEAERAEVVAAASAQLEELTLLVGDLIDLARDGRPAADEIEDVRLDEIVYESAARINGGRVQVDSEPTLVRGNRTRLARAVSNLIDNAIKYSPDGSPVEVTVRGGEVAVRDHGPGIASEDLPHVFDRFYRAPSARGTPGSGLGLAIVRQVAEAHQGTAVAEPAEGGGARLLLSVPALS